MHFVECGPAPASLQDIVAKGFGDPDAYAKFIPDLRRPFNRLCGYCERPCRHGQVDHFRPRYHFPELTFTWENLIYVCHRCNKVKDDQFPGKTPLDANAVNLLNADAESRGKQFVDPSEDDGYVNPRDQAEKAETFFVFNREGEILPNPNLDDRDWSKARRTIRDFDLNPVGGSRGTNLCSLRTAAFTQWEVVALEAARGRTRNAKRMSASLDKLAPGFPSFIAWAFSNALNQI